MLGIIVPKGIGIIVPKGIGIFFLYIII